MDDIPAVARQMEEYDASLPMCFLYEVTKLRGVTGLTKRTSILAHDARAHHLRHLSGVYNECPWRFLTCATIVPL